MFVSVCSSPGEEGFMCKTPAIADIVILVDGSWSIGRINFRLVRTFLENLVKAFSVEFDKTRIGEQVLISEFQAFHCKSYIHTIWRMFSFKVSYLASVGLKSVV